MIALVTERLMYAYIELTGNLMANYTKSCIVKTINMVKATDVCDEGNDAKQIIYRYSWHIDDMYTCIYKIHIRTHIL